MYDKEMSYLIEWARTMSKCKRRKVAAMVVGVEGSNCIGLNCEGPISGLCAKQCLREELGIASGVDPEACRGWHAEQTAIMQAGLTKCVGKTLITTLAPCVSCAKWIIAAGITTVVYKDSYTSDLGLRILREGGVEVIEYKETDNGISI